MFEMPTPKIEGINAITMTSPDLEKSLAYYQKLGFSEVFRADFPFPWIQISDGVLLMMLRKDVAPYIALTYYVKDIDKLVATLEADGVSFTTKPVASDMIKRCLIKSPDGMYVSLVMIVDGFEQPPGLTMLKMPQQDYFNPEKYANKVCGLFGELAHPVKDIDTSMEFWDKLGFKILSRMSSPYPWAIISDGASVVGLHQTEHFAKPTITFFASDMKAKIEKLKAGGLTDFVEKGESNIVLTTPEEQHINLFILGM